MNIFLRNISPNDIASVNYEEVPGSTQLDGEAEVVLTTDGDTAMVDIPVTMLQQTTINTPMLLRITATNSNTIDINLVYLSGSWNDEVDVVADANKTVKLDVNASRPVKFKDLRKVLAINTDAMLTTIEQAFEE
jgi:hypothetical protein